MKRVKKNEIVTDYYTYVTASDDSLKKIIERIHERGLRVMLKPQIDLTEDPKFWRGQIGVNFTSSEWDEWFGSYEKMILHYAHLAEQTHVEMLSVSCELVVASKQADHWRKVVKTIREKYHGLLTDSANWGWLIFASF